MAYVVARPKGRFEIRESVHTPKGPRARSLANFSQVTEAVLATAASRATRPFNDAAVRAAAERAGAPGPVQRRRTFVESSRRMARSLESRPTAAQSDPGDALIDLLGFVAQIAPFRTATAATTTPDPLRFPVMARLWAAHGGPTPRG
jgi:hypothetical protein